MRHSMPRRWPEFLLCVSALVAAPGCPADEPPPAPADAPPSSVEVPEPAPEATATPAPAASDAEYTRGARTGLPPEIDDDE